MLTWTPELNRNAGNKPGERRKDRLAGYMKANTSQIRSDSAQLRQFGIVSFYVCFN